MKFELFINCNDSVFVPNPRIEIRRILKELVDRIEEGLVGLSAWNLRDIDGITVGVAQLEGARWSKEWPNGHGWYWFFGKRSKAASKPGLFPAQVKRTSNSIVYVCSGTFLHKEEGAEGVWTPMVVPDLPETKAKWTQDPQPSG